MKTNLNKTQVLNQSVNLNAPINDSKPVDSGNENIKVMIRIRNVSLTESQRLSPILVENNQIRIQYTNDMKSQTYSFDKVATEDKNQEYMYSEIGQPVVDYCLEGFNACIFAYGQTGAGKTYTMTGTQTDPGIQPRVLENIFSQLNKKVETQDLLTYKISVSYYEIYNEQINDLINNRKDIKIRENFEGPFIENLTIEPVSSISEAQVLFNRSTKNRSIAATLMNKSSSRSHSIFTVNIQMVDQNMNETSSKLNFIDMAGSERQKKTQAEGQRLKEAGSINKSLFEFSKVIGDLAKQKLSVVFRNSKLTHILKDCLIGNSRTFIICAINPSYYHIDETENTLKFASNAKFIETKPFCNQVVKVNVEELQKQLRDYEIAIEQNNIQLSEKDNILQQMKMHHENQDEEINQLRNYYCKQISDIEADKLQQLNFMQNNQLKLSQQKGLIDNQEIQIKDLKEKIRKLLEEKSEYILQQEKNKLQSKTDIESASDNSTIDEKTPTPGEFGFMDFDDRIIQLEAEVSILRNQNFYNKSVQKELEHINQQLSSQNKEMHLTSSNLLREKESLLMEMNKINESFGQKSQMLSSEIENFKEQSKIYQQKLESQIKENKKLQKFIHKLKQENEQLTDRIQLYEKELFNSNGELLQDEDKNKKLSLYLKQIHTLTSELKRKSEHERLIEDERQKILQKKQSIIQQQQKIHRISQSILLEISSDSKNSVEEISQNQFNCNLKEILEQKCKELGDIKSEVEQELDKMKQQNDTLRNIIENKEYTLNQTKQFFLDRNKKNKRDKHIQEQLEIFFIENPEFYINKKKLECFENFIHFVFSQIHALMTTNSLNSSQSNLIQSNGQHSNILRVKEFIESANGDMLMYHFKELVENEKKVLLRKYCTLKDFLLQLVQSRNDENISPHEEQRYSEYIDLYAESNQVQQIRTLIFEEYNPIKLRKSKRSPCKIYQKNCILDKNIDYMNLIDTYQGKNINSDDKKSIYDFTYGKKKIKTNDY